MSDPDRPLAVVDVHLSDLWLWEQHRGGGCRCACRYYHPRIEIPDGGMCLEAAEPGHLIQVSTLDETRGPLPVCADCYALLCDTYTD